MVRLLFGLRIGNSRTRRSRCIVVWLLLLLVLLVRVPLVLVRVCVGKDRFKGTELQRRRLLVLPVNML